MTLDELRSRLDGECRREGGQASWARACGLSPGYVSDVVTGRRDPGAALLKAMKVDRVVTYEDQSPPVTGITPGREKSDAEIYADVGKHRWPYVDGPRPQPKRRPEPPVAPQPVSGPKPRPVRGGASAKS